MKVTFPHMGNAWITIKALFENLNVDVVIPPINSKRTLDLGTKLSPESACLPLKINLGNYVEAAKDGADTIVITGGIGPCRFGYYGELERQILRDAGYNYDVVILEPPDGSLMGLAERIRYLAGKHNSWPKILKAIHFAFQKSVALDRLEDLTHGARAYIEDKAETEKLYEEAVKRIDDAGSYKGLQEVIKWVQESIRDRQLTEKSSGGTPVKPLKIGLVGEIYTILDPFTSVDVERQLGHLGAHVDRSIYLSGWIGQHVFQGLYQGYRPMKPYHALAKPFLNHFVGGHGQETVGAAVKFAREGFDGIIQLLPLTCMPEIVAASILPRVQDAYQIPIMTLTVDEHTGRAGFQTRLEAFVDLLERSRLNKLKDSSREEVLNLAQG